MSPDEMLDYALGQCEGARREQADREIASNPALAARLDVLTGRLHLLLDDGDELSPPDGLAERTIALVAVRKRWVLQELIPIRRLPFRLADVAVAASLFLVGMLALVPAAQRARIAARGTACVNNLQRLGVGLARYATTHNTYPYAAPESDAPYAGAFAVLINDAGLLPDPSALDCPVNGLSDRLPETLPAYADLCSLGPEGARRAPCIREIDYAYNLGRQVRGRPRPLPSRLSMSSLVPLLSDRPPFEDDVRILDGNSPNHGGGGQNVLFGDGHVEWHRSRRLGPDPDMFLNGLHRLAPGVDEHDFVLAPGVTRVDGR